MPEQAPITFVIPGRLLATRGTAVPAAPRGGGPGRLKASVQVGTRRAGEEPVRVLAVPGEDVVVLHLANGPSLTLSPESARDLLLGQGSARRSAGLPQEVVVGASLRWSGLESAAPVRTRGFLGDVLLQAVEVVTGFGADIVVDKVKDRVDGQVETGIYALSPEQLAPLKGSGRLLAQGVPPAPVGRPILVMLHGTFVDTHSTFVKLWQQHPGKVRDLFAHYENRVYAFDHATLGESPIGNALALVAKLPRGARLHLVTHSRGGLVAEVLARACAQQTLSDADRRPFLEAQVDGKPVDERAQLRALESLVAAIKDKGIRVDRVVRVACPARGTLLASRRLDAYLSVLKWTLELAGLPVAPALVDFLSAVARRREDPMKLPGLAAMVPHSPLVQWLNASSSPVPGELRVVAGDLEGDSIGTWVKTLLADAFYWTDNDIVVQTRSMYGGTPRQGGASYLLDQGGKVTHFNYFGNDRTAAAIVGALIDDRPAGYRAIGPLSWAGEDSSGLRAARKPRAAGKDRQALHDKPALFMLPGILGSHLKAGDQRIWLSVRLIGGLDRLAWHDGGDDVSPDGPIGMFYDELIEFLDDSHEVIPFGFDWRRPIEDEAARLAVAVSRALDERDGNRKPVRLIAHSMGGVVARTMQIVAPEVWNRMMERDDARLLMLGTPNGGSWAPMQVLSGDDSFGNALAAFGAPFQDHAARQLMANMPGFIQLQADLRDPNQGLDKEATWQKLADDDLAIVREANWWHMNWLNADGSVMQLNPYRWGVPPQKVLDRARDLRAKLDAQRDQHLPEFADRLLLVTGQAEFTPDGTEWTREGLVYRNAVNGGDGRVALVDALLPGVRTWTLNCEHGSLPDARGAFDAYLELLTRGNTDKLERLATGSRGRAAESSSTMAHELARPSRGRRSLARPAESAAALLTMPVCAPDESTGPDPSAALRVTVCNGDLTFVREPLIVGHYRSTSLTGTERVVDRMVGGTMTASFETGLYPDLPGSHQVFLNTRSVTDNPWRAPRPEAVVVIGLGDEGTLKASELARAVRQAALAWVQRLAERQEGSLASIEMAATLIGSGGLGVTPGDAAEAIARGVRDAADIVRQTNKARRDAAPEPRRHAVLEWPVITHLTLIELYLERAAEAWRSLQVLATAMPGRYAITPTIVAGTGPLRRQIETAYRGADYDLIAVESSPHDDGSIAYRLDTRRARTEVRAQATQATLVRELVRRAANDASDDPRIGTTLFKLLVPQEMEAYLGGTERMVLELDEQTSAIPWELLDPGEDQRAGSDRRPWAVRTQLLRKLRKSRFRTQVQDAGADAHVLVIGEPRLTDTRYAALPGALAEAREVASTLKGPQGIAASRVHLVEQAEATTILNELFARRYRIVHVSGHGEAGANGGLVMSDGTVLGPREIGQMRAVPELVFVNCCHLAARDAPQLLAPAGRLPMNRAEFAASVADALIEVGVRCVVAAGWAVEDEPARCFANVLYRELLAGRPFIRALAQAREEAWRQGEAGNTWAAYQCYGDPDWTLRRETGDAQTQRRDTVMEDFENIASPLGLVLALEKLAVESQFQGRPAAGQLDRIRHLEARFGNEWSSMGAVAEAFGLAYMQAKDSAKAIDWYGAAVRSNDASASMKAVEQLLNLRARHALEAATLAVDRPRALASARARIVAVLRQMQALTDLHPTVERHSLCGSTWKRLAMLEQQSGRASAAETARRRCAASYEEAERLAIATDHPELYYPALNRMAAALAAHSSRRTWPGFDAEVVARVRESLQRRITHDPDFWSMVGIVEVDAFVAIASHGLALALEPLLDRLRDLKMRAAAPHQWDSVAATSRFALAGWQASAAAPERAALAKWQALLDDHAAG